MSSRSRGHPPRTRPAGRRANLTPDAPAPRPRLSPCWCSCALLLVACAASPPNAGPSAIAIPSHTAPAQPPSKPTPPPAASAPTPSPATPSSPTCTPLDRSPCRAGEARRPVRTSARTELFSTDGKTVFYFAQGTDFDLATFRVAAVSDCPVWEDVYARDKRSVYVLEPQSCGGANCGGDYTGFGWGSLDVWSPATFRWLSGGYATDGERVYNRWFEGPLDGARPASFEILSCSTVKDSFIVGRDGDRFYVDGRLATKDTPEAARDARRGKSSEKRPSRGH
jgi:hypothetical protein